MKSKSLSIFLAVVMLFSLIVGIVPAAAAENPYAPTEFVEFDGVAFGRATESYNEETVNARTGETSVTEYKGIPLFDGKEEHLDAYIDLLLKEMGEESIIAAASTGTVTGSYVNEAGETVTYRVPTGVGRSADVGNDGGTQWPNQLGVAQSWNKELTKEMGSQYGSEIRAEKATGTIGGSLAVSAHVAQIDPHLNPLAGRYDEGYGEDAYMISMLVNAWGQGMRGDDSDFYYKSIAHTKHWGVYSTEFFRMQGSYNVSARSFYEYFAAAVNRPFSEGAILGLMSSYGRVNGVPSTSSFIQTYAQMIAPNGLATGCDFMSEYGYTASAGWMSGNAWSNGYDPFYSSGMNDRNALMILSGHKQGGNAMAAASLPPEAGINFKQNEVLAEDIENSVLGLTMDDVVAIVRPGLIEVVRTGALNVRGADGQPLEYPYLIEENDNGSANYHQREDIQQVALKAAQESIVLLKNDNEALPLAKDSKLNVYGAFADIYQYGLYSAALTEITTDEALPTYSANGIPAGLTVAEALGCKEAFSEALSGTLTANDNNSYDAARKVVTLQLGGKYVTSDADGVITLADEISDGAYFELEDWGQDAYSFLSVMSGKWLDANMGNPSNAANFVLKGTELSATYDANFKPLSHGQVIDSDFPDFFEIKEIDGESYIKAGSKFNVTDFGANFAVPDLMGWYLKNDDGKLALDTEEELGETGTLVNGAPVTEANGMGDEYKFVMTEIPAEITADGDAAIIVVGVVYNGISGEGVDRLYLGLGENMAEQAAKLAAAYKAAGKTTVLIIKADAPIEADAFKNDENIDAILFMPMGGQYEGYAMSQVLYGDVNPSGKTVGTWYKSQSQLPAIDKYSVPALANATVDGKGGNPMYKMLGLPDAAALGELKLVTLDDISVITDMDNCDLQDSRLTYAYFTDEVTWPFGYGLSYTSFEYGDFEVNDASADAPFTASVTVKNTGSVDGAEAVELYISKTDSAYGEAAPIKRLVSFEKVALAAGESKTVTLTVDPQDLAIWDVNAEKYIVEDGAYTVYASDSSALDGKNTLKQEISISGETLAALPADVEANVWEHSFDSSAMQYVEYSKGQTIAAARAEGVGDDTFAVMSRAAGAYVAIPQVNLAGVTGISAKVASIADGNVVEVRLDAPDGELLGELKFDKTEAVTVTRDEANPELAGSYTELGYTAAAAAVSGEGVHDVYLVFKSADSRIATITFTTGEQEAVSFSDVSDDDWFAPAVYAAAASGLAEGKGDGTFAPDEELTWAQTVTFAVRLYELDAETKTAAAEGKEWYKPYFDAAVEYAIIKEAPADPDAIILRADAAVIFAAVLGEAEAVNEVAPDYFKDIPADSAAYEAVYALAAAGVCNGKGENEFGAADTFKRSEAAAITARIAGLVEPAAIAK